MRAIHRREQASHFTRQLFYKPPPAAAACSRRPLLEPPSGEQLVPAEPHLCPDVQPWVAGQPQSLRDMLSGRGGVPQGQSSWMSHPPTPPQLRLQRPRARGPVFPTHGGGAQLWHLLLTLSCQHRAQDASRSPPPRWAVELGL